MGKKKTEAGSRHPCVENGEGGGEIEAWGHIDENQKYCLSHRLCLPAIPWRVGTGKRFLNLLYLLVKSLFKSV